MKTKVFAVAVGLIFMAVSAEAGMGGHVMGEMGNSMKDISKYMSDGNKSNPEL